ncbi:hypothetical protein ACFOOK_19785 [Micromonospora krabiensis]|uniref:Uncharacterized protein n=1 Tax=Micromonospora krabiensis TaxID=307121 RepID=A0A1C3N9B1_9ACTN|nr:hypothetical protein GA0070620_4754 [Micromonospora krabiensis]
MQPPAGSQVSSGQPAALGVPTPAPAPAPAQVPAQRPPSEQLPPPPATPTPERPRRRVRTVLTVVAGVLALLCLGGGIAGYVLYDRATAPDRSAPDVVVANYIQAFLNDRNDTKAEGFACAGDADLDGLRMFRDELVSREGRFDTEFSVRWGPLDVRQSGDTATVEVDLIISAVVDGVTQSDRQRWRFETRQKDGWGVCTAQLAS